MRYARAAVSAPRTRLVPALSFFAFALLVAGAVVFWKIREADEADARRRADERHAAEERARAEQLIARTREESKTLIPTMLEGVVLGMSEEELQRLRPASVRDTRNPDRVLMFRKEDLRNGANVVYGFDRRAQRLVQVQVLSLLPAVGAIAPHLTAMNEQYGRPSGYWDCPDTGGVPTRRFTWRKSALTVMDVMLIFRGRVSLTLYIAPNMTIAASLQRARCRPVTAEEMERFPVATDEQMGQIDGPPETP